MDIMQFIVDNLPKHLYVSPLLQVERTSCIDIYHIDTVEYWNSNGKCSKDPIAFLYSTHGRMYGEIACILLRSQAKIINLSTFLKPICNLEEFQEKFILQFGYNPWRKKKYEYTTNTVYTNGTS